jgi:aspartyl-tRNA(Asn)/glutamyl-tRNA(Gln) amidotransferase subunit B
MEQYDLSEYDAGVLTAQKAYADYFEESIGLHENYKALCNWIMGGVLRELNDRKITLSELPISPKMLASMVRMIDEGKITSNIAKEVFIEMAETGKSPEKIVEEKGLSPITDAGEIDQIVEEVIRNNPKPVQDYQSGKERVIGFLVGQVMKAVGGKADAKLVNKTLREKLKR